MNNSLSNIKTVSTIASSLFLSTLSIPVCANPLDMNYSKESVSTSIGIAGFSKPVTFHPFDERLKKILSLSNNWDGYDASSIDISVYCNTRDFLEKLDDKFLDCLKEENILPTPYGTITLDFESEDNLVSVEIGKDQIGFFTDFMKKENIKSNGENFVNNNIPCKLKNVLIDLVS
jgi:hypothetical protein